MLNIIRDRGKIPSNCIKEKFVTLIKKSVTSTGEYHRNVKNAFNVAMTSVISDKTDCEGIKVYGITVRTTEGKLLYYPDISSNYVKVERLLDILVENDISIIHINDVIEDYIV